MEGAYGKEYGGLKLVLLTDRTGLLRPNAPVYYRGIEVGAIQSTHLNADATAAEIHVVIQRRYASLVRTGSRFWNSSGADIHFGLFKGLDINVESLRSLLSGGIAFATPDAKAKPVKDGTTFRLNDEPHKDWLKWAPAIPLSRGEEAS